MTSYDFWGLGGSLASAAISLCAGNNRTNVGSGLRCRPVFKETDMARQRIPLGTSSSLVDTPLAELMARARAVRHARTGTRITYSPKVFIPLTMLCRDTCGYCTFAQPPARLE
ncbi:MAG: hypothetical protein ACKPBG_02645, partial [Actinomycetota bacterium]